MLAIAIAITLQDESAANLRRMARPCRNVAQDRHQPASASVMDGHSRIDAATAAGMDGPSLRDSVHRFNAERPAGLVDNHIACDAALREFGLDGGELTFVVDFDDAPVAILTGANIAGLSTR